MNLTPGHKVLVKTSQVDVRLVKLKLNFLVPLEPFSSTFTGTRHSGWEDLV